MRITYLHQYFNTPSMPGGTRSYEMARRLVANGHQVNMVTSWREDDGRSDWFLTNEAGIKVHWLPVPYSNHMGYGERLRSFFRFAYGAYRKAASLPADVVFATSTPLTIALPGVYAARRQKVPLVFEVRDLWPELPIAIGALKNPFLQFVARRLEQFAYRNSKAIVALSPGMLYGVIKAGYPAEQVRVIPNSSDLDHFYPDMVRRRTFRARYGIPETAVLVVYAGTFGRINGVDYLVRVAAELKDDQVFHFLTVGDGQEHAKVKEIAEELGCLGQNLTILPKIPKAEMPYVLAAADIATSLFIPLPEMEANSANKFFDGLAAGCCMAINYGGWHAETLAESGAGLRLDQSAEIAAKQLQDFVNTPGSIANARERARRLAEERFARDKLAVELEQVLVAAVNGT